MRYGFCPSKKAWTRLMRRLKVKDPAPYPEVAGSCTQIRRDDGEVVVIVTVHERMDDANPIAIAGVIVHEATHVFQFICEAVGEEEPGRETQAYAMQNIVMGLLDAYNTTRRGVAA